MIINSKMEFATDQDCADRRNELIDAGILTPASAEEVVIKGNEVHISTIKQSGEERMRLVNNNIINPNACDLRPEKNRKPSSLEEGEIKNKSVDSEEEYLRRRAAYFRMMQEIIFSRRDLNLILAKKEERDPDWFF